MNEFVGSLTLASSIDSKVRWGNVLWRILIAFACAIFLTSILNPFLDAHWTGLRIPEVYSSLPGEMWSFKQHFYYWNIFGPTLAYVELSFGQYWFQDWHMGIASWTGYALMSIFILQVLTIALGIFLIFKSNRSSIPLPIVLNTLVVILMSVVSNGMKEDFARTFQPGFWLALLSIAPFLLAAVAYFYLRRH
jgi:hypothetical protein